MAAVSGKRGKRYLKRQQLMELGQELFAYLGEIVHRRPDTWYQDVDTMHDVLQRDGETVFLAAVRAAFGQQLYGGEYVRWFAENGRVEQRRAST